MSFDLDLRIPRWCRDGTVLINGSPSERAVTRGTFHRISREWSAGDRIEIDLPMPVRLVADRKAQSGRVALMRGPTVFCLNRTRIKGAEAADLRLLVIDPGSVSTAAPDDSVHPDGRKIELRAWGADAEALSRLQS